MRTALLIVDMQRGSFPPYQDRFDREGVVARINRLGAAVRSGGGRVIAVQHDGPAGDPHHPDAPGWPLLPDLSLEPEDLQVRKTACDAFLNTGLERTLIDLGIESLLVTGCASDYCVDTTVRTALGKGFAVTVPSDAHTTSDKPYMSAEAIITHHNAVWADFIAPAGPAAVQDTASLLARLRGR